MTIYLGTDHGGFELKEEVKMWLQGQGHTVEDCGAFQLDPNDDYPDFALTVAQKVSVDTSGQARGILFCRSGGGVIIAANKVKGIRAVVVNDPASAKHARNDNNANIIGLAADWLDRDEVPAIIAAFLKTPFSSEPRHARRLQKISDFENQP